MRLKTIAIKSDSPDRLADIITEIEKNYPIKIMQTHMSADAKNFVAFISYIPKC